MSLSRQLAGVGDVATSIYSTVVYTIGLIWLSQLTDVDLLLNNWELFVFMGALTYVFSKLNFFMIIEFRKDRYGSADGAFDSMMVWTATLMFGPSAIWMIVILQVLQALLIWRHQITPAAKWDAYRSFSLTLAGFTIPYIIGLKAYEAFGGVYPMEALDAGVLLAGLVGIATNYLILVLIWVPYFNFAMYSQRLLAAESDGRPITTFFVLALTLPSLAHPFAILAAGFYVQNGMIVFLFFVTGLLVVAYLTRQFSKIAESNRQQSRQLEKLEAFGRAILNAPPDNSTLSQILNEHIPNMFPSSSIAMWVLPGQTLYKSPEDWDKDFRPIWFWMQDQTEPQVFVAGETTPWAQGERTLRPVVTTPIRSHEGAETIGGIYLELRQLAQPWDRKSLANLFPAMMALSDQISSAIHQAEEYAQILAYQKVDQEIQLAGQIQASFLPNQFPSIPGWQLAVSLKPAGGLSGDFFDFIPLSRGRYGLLIADVADKGLGAALYMALSRTLLRTYAFEYHSRPDIVLSETNDRILNDARANLFITCFYGVLDPINNTLMYCNAGHNPPYLLRAGNGTGPIPLERTGMPIGIDEDTSWERHTIEIYPGDKLVMYTDGVTEAQNEKGEFFEDKLLLKTVMEHLDESVYDLQDNILHDIHEFIGDTRQDDDITLMIISKEREDVEEE